MVVRASITWNIQDARRLPWGPALGFYSDLIIRHDFFMSYDSPVELESALNLCDSHGSKRGGGAERPLPWHRLLLWLTGRKKRKILPEEKDPSITAQCICTYSCFCHCIRDHNLYCSITLLYRLYWKDDALWDQNLVLIHSVFNIWRNVKICKIYSESKKKVT